MKRQFSSDVYACPYWRWNLGGTESCDAATLRFPNEKTHETFIAGHCINVRGWEKCAFAAALTRYFEEENGKEESGFYVRNKKKIAG